MTDTTIDQLTEDEARRLGAVEVFERLESPYKSYAEELANFYKRNYLEDASEAFADRFGWAPDNPDARDRYFELRSAFFDGFNAAVSVASRAADEARPRGDEGVQAALAWIRERDEREEAAGS